MNAFFSKWLALAVICGFSSTVFSQQSNGATANDEGELPTRADRERVWFTSFLFTAGNQLGCYFTMEYRSRNLTGKEVKMDTYITNGLAAFSIPSLVSNLTVELKGYTVVRDSNNPIIIHIIDQALEQQSNYVMNKPVSIQYSGNLVGSVVQDAEGRNLGKGEGLVTAISRQTGGGITSGEISHTDPVQGGNDFTTLVNVNATNQTVRSILANSIPLTNYSRILWRAVMTRQAPSETEPELRIQFFGPRH
jgi:hypothetical protein